MKRILAAVADLLVGAGVVCAVTALGYAAALLGIAAVKAMS